MAAFSRSNTQRKLSRIVQPLLVYVALMASSWRLKNSPSPSFTNPATILVFSRLTITLEWSAPDSCPMLVPSPKLAARRLHHSDVNLAVQFPFPRLRASRRRQTLWLLIDLL